MAASTVSPIGSTATPARPARHRELDVLGTCIVLSLIFVHTGSIFSGQQLVVNKDQGPLTALFFGLVVSWEIIWIMPTMMTIAGMSVWYSLRSRTPGQFVRERALRLLVPCLIGTLLLIPPQVYYMVLFHEPGYQETFWQFYPRFWNIEFALSTFPIFFRSRPPDNLFNPIHLWFIDYLFVYTLILLPLFLYLRGEKGRALRERVTGFLARPRTLYLLVLPYALIEGFLASEWPGGWNRWVWPIFIFYGFLLATDDRCSDALVRHRKSALVWGIVGFLIYFMGLGMLMQQFQVDPWADRGGPAIVVRLIKSLASWCWVIAVLGFAMRWGRRSGAVAANEPASPPRLMERLASYGREAQLPFYVLHQTPIIVIGFYVVQWPMNVLLKFLIISLASLVITLLVYEFGVRRWAVTRFLFGMRPKSAG